MTTQPHDFDQDRGQLTNSSGSKSVIRLHPSWLRHLENEFAQPYMSELRHFLKQEKTNGKTIYPPSKLIFNALDTTPFEKVKVVILGQDPYHGPQQAHGLSFSVQEGIPLPPSLLNIFKELKSDLGFEISRNGDLTNWAKQGVLLLNASLTVEQGKPLSHQEKGWLKFTDKVIEVLNKEKNNLVFILWGSFAQKKGALVDRNKHLVIESPHPSPLSSHRGFFGSRPFSKTNEYLSNNNLQPIEWRLS